VILCPTLIICAELA
jgi:serine/threonine-protein phosphatase 2B regulatory subunit